MPPVQVLAGLAAYERCLECQPSNRNAASNRLLTINYAYPGEGASVCKAHAEWGHNFQKVGAVLCEQVQAACLWQPSKQVSSQLEDVTSIVLSCKQQAAA